MFENNQTPKTVLLIQLRQLGDILLTTPTFRAVKKKWPECRLLVLTHEMGRLVLNGNPYIDEHITYNEESGIFSVLGVIKDLEKKKLIYSLISCLTQKRDLFQAFWREKTSFF